MARKSAKTRITAKQKSARRKNMAIARKAKKKSPNLGKLEKVREKRSVLGSLASMRGNKKLAKKYKRQAKRVEAKMKESPDYKSFKRKRQRGASSMRLPSGKRIY